MSRNYGKAFSISVSGLNRDLSDMSLRFEIKDWTVQTPRNAFVRIYNLSDATAQQILGSLGKMLRITAGYEGNSGQIFQGDIKFVRKGKENPTDTYCDIFAADGYKGYTKSHTNTSVKAGSTGKDIYDACLKDMAKFGLSPGYVADAVKQIKYPRQSVLYGMTRDFLRTLAQSKQCTWHILNGKVNIVPAGGTLPGASTIVLNSQSGLIGLPEQTPFGITARILLNPQVDIHSIVQIDEKSIQRAAYNPATGQGEVAQSVPNLSPVNLVDGTYHVLSVSHIGETRGNDWYADITCASTQGGSITTSQASAGYTVGPN